MKDHNSHLRNNNGPIESLSLTDIKLVVERFDFAGSVNMHNFVGYFDDISSRLKTIENELTKEGVRVSRNTNTVTTDGDKDPQGVNVQSLVATSAAPFRASSEWGQLKSASYTPETEDTPLERKFKETVHSSFADEFATAQKKGLPLPTQGTDPNDVVKQLAKNTSSDDKDEEDDLLATLEADAARQSAKHQADMNAEADRRRSAAEKERQNKLKQEREAEAEKKRLKEAEAAAELKKKKDAEAEAKKKEAADAEADRKAKEAKQAIKSPGKANRILKAYAANPHDFEDVSIK